MILPVFGKAGLVACAVLAAAPARADVLEIGTDGQTRWIAGPLVAAAPEPGNGDAALVFAPDDLANAIPETAVADPARPAALIPATYAAKVAELAARFDLSPALLEAVVWQESRWRHNAVSPAGAQGLAQLMPGTAREMGVDPADPFANLEGGARYLRQQLDRFDGDIERALAAYNAGPGRVEKAGGIPAIRETRLYVAAIMGRLSSHSRSPE